MAQNPADTHYRHSSALSLQARLVSWGLKRASLKTVLEKDLSRPEMKKRDTPLPKSFSDKFQVETHEIAGNTNWIIQPKGKKSEKTILFLHGGGYVYGVQGIYWNFLEALVHQTKARVIMPDYPLAPNHTANEVFSFMEQVYAWVETLTTPQELILMGDSAGGGLAFGFCQQLRDQQQTLPSQLILLSPWLDLALDHPDIPPLEDGDVILATKGLRMAGAAYAGSWAQDDPRVSPIKGQFQGLPPMSIFVGTGEIFHPDCEKLVAQLSAQHLPYQYFVYPKLFHDWFVVVPKMKESRLALRQMKEIILT